MGLLQNLQLNVLPFLSKGDPNAPPSTFTTEFQGLQYSDPDVKGNAQ